MNQKKNSGFTLIELLAVIVILAIIALIAVPVIMNIISKANESAFKDSAYGVIQAGELYFAEQLLEPNGMQEDVTIQLPDNTKKLQIKGEVPTGSILITTEGKVAIAVHNNRYCVTKGLEDKDVTITENYDECNNPASPKILSDLVTTSTKVTSIPACLNDDTVCTPGTPVAIKVNATEVYNFYVLNEAENEVTLIMDRNLYSEEDLNSWTYNVAWYADSFDASNGPKTAIEKLKERTSTWTNISERLYTYSNDYGEIEYTSFTEKMRARMLTYTEAVDESIGCVFWSESCPTWLYDNLHNTGDSAAYGYWLSSAYGSSKAIFVYYDGYLEYYGIRDKEFNGIRPVITITK